MGHVYFQCISVYRLRKSTSVWRQGRVSYGQRHTHSQWLQPCSEDTVMHWQSVSTPPPERASCSQLGLLYLTPSLSPPKGTSGSTSLHLSKHPVCSHGKRTQWGRMETRLPASCAPGQKAASPLTAGGESLMGMASLLVRGWALLKHSGLCIASPSKGHINYSFQHPIYTWCKQLTHWKSPWW